MPSSTPSLFEPVLKLAQSNFSTWTQFLTAPDQPWSPGKIDLFGSRPFMPALLPSSDTVTRLWNELVENHNRFISEWTQRSGEAFAALPHAAEEAAQAATA
jgi:hypothetical protein